MPERLDKILSEAGVASRSEIRKMVRAGRVFVNGVPAVIPEMKLQREEAVISIDGERINTARFRTFMMNKPSGVLSVTEDRKQATVLDLLRGSDRNLGLFPVGRLDKDTRGLLLLTNDGELSHRIISPSSEISKVYEAVVDGIPDEEDVKAFAKGIVLKDGTECLPARLQITGENTCLVTVFEGKYHQVKRMLAARGKPVTGLRRISVGSLILDPELEEGNYRELANDELCKILNSNSS